MTDPAAQLEAIIDTLGCLGIPVQKERLGGLGGGLCAIRGERILFLDIDADLATQLNACLAALASLPEADGVYLIPALRERVERFRADSDFA